MANGLRVGIRSPGPESRGNWPGQGKRALDQFFAWHVGERAVCARVVESRRLLTNNMGRDSSYANCSGKFFCKLCLFWYGWMADDGG
jgi:hypothetical protein